MRYFYLLIILLLSSCQTSKIYQRSEHSKIADRITAKTARKIETETGLRLIGVGGSMMDQVRMMAMSFEYLEEMTMEQARELLIYCVDEYLSAINSNEEIRPHLIHYPFMPKDVQIRIFIYKPDHRDVPVGSLSVVAAIEGILDYDIQQPGLPSFKKIHEETYEEAVKILESWSPENKIRKNGYCTKRV